MIYPGRNAYYRRVNDNIESFHEVLMKFHLYKNETFEANSEIILDWGKKLVTELNTICPGVENTIIFNGYGAHIQFEFLNYLKSKSVIVIALPAHTSHVLQPLDVTVFGPYKSYLQLE